MAYEGLIPLGAKVKDAVTGIEGTVTSICFHVTGCTRYWIEGKINKGTGKYLNLWVDEARLKRVGNAVLDMPLAEAVVSAPSPSDCGPPNESARP